MCDTNFQVAQVFAFTINGDNENVTCDLNAVTSLFPDIDILQVELCGPDSKSRNRENPQRDSGKTLAKIFTPDQDTANTVRDILQASIDKICYTEDTVLAVTIPQGSNLTFADIRTRLWGNVEIRAFFQCGTAGSTVYVQVPPEYLKFAQDILEACEEDLTTLPCYKHVPLECACVPTPLEIVQAVGDSNTEQNSLTIPIIVSQTGNSLYLAVQLLFITNSGPMVSVTDNGSPFALTPDKTGIGIQPSVLAQVWHKDNVTAGPHSITISISFSSPPSTAEGIFAQVVEIQGTANPSIDPNTIGSGSSGTGILAQDSLTPTFNNELGFMSVGARNASTIFSGPDGSLLILPAETQIGIPGAGAALKKVLNGGGISQFMQAVISPIGIPNWAAAAVGIIPKTCPITNCHFPVPNCNFQYPCISCKKCQKDGKKSNY